MCHTFHYYISKTQYHKKTVTVLKWSSKSLGTWSNRNVNCLSKRQRNFNFSQIYELCSFHSLFSFFMKNPYDIRPIIIYLDDSPVSTTAAIKGELISFSDWSDELSFYYRGSLAHEIYGYWPFTVHRKKRKEPLNFGMNFDWPL